MNIKKWIFGCLSAGLLSTMQAEQGQAIVSIAGDVKIEKSADDEAWLYATPEQAQWLKDARFGLFVHWGPISQLGHDLSWPRKGGRRWGKIKAPDNGFIPMEEYDVLYKTFNPVDFKPKEWVKMMKEAGQKYIVFTAKHHDGFCMFDSAYTDYDIMSTPYGKDILKELTDACHEAGIRVGIYYSPTDWYHPDFRTENHDRYVEFYFNQMRELVTKYAPVDVIWWDAFGFHGESELIKSKEMTKMLRELQPGILLNNRAAIRGDFDTPEQLVGRFQKDRPWETCMTINDQWGYRPNNEPKSKKVLVETLVRCAGGNGNFLLNLGPMANGKFDPIHKNRLLEVGDWRKKYGISVFETKGGPYMPGVYGACTYRDDTIYVHMMDWSDKDQVSFPALPFKVLSHRVLTGGQADLKQTAEGIFITMKDKHDPIDTIIELKVDGDVGTIEPVKVPYHSGSLALNKPAKASSVLFDNLKHNGPQLALDDDVDTMWRTDMLAIKDLTFEVDFEKPTLINRITMRDAHKRTRHFSLLYEKDGKWLSFYEKVGNIGHHFDEVFDPFTTEKIRLSIHKAIAGPQLTEFHVFYDPDKKKNTLANRYIFKGNSDDTISSNSVLSSINQTFTEAPTYSKDIPINRAADAPQKSLLLGETYGSKKSGLFFKGGDKTILSSTGSLSVWVKAEDIQTGNYLFFAPSPAMMLFFPNENKLSFSIGRAEHKKHCSVDFAKNEWHLLTLSWDQFKGKVDFYLDGNQVSSFKGFSTKLNMGGDIRVGNYDDPSSNRKANLVNQFQGNIYDLQFYNRALSPQEVKELFEQAGNVID